MSINSSIDPDTACALDPLTTTVDKFQQNSRDKNSLKLWRIRGLSVAYLRLPDERHEYHILTREAEGAVP